MVKKPSFLTACGQKAACNLKVALIFGKKPVPRGAGEREGERERNRETGIAREMQEMCDKHITCRVCVLERNREGNRAETRLPGRSGRKARRNGSPAGFGRLE